MSEAYEVIRNYVDDNIIDDKLLCNLVNDVIDNMYTPFEKYNMGQIVKLDFIATYIFLVTVLHTSDHYLGSALIINNNIPFYATKSIHNNYLESDYSREVIVARNFATYSIFGPIKYLTGYHDLYTTVPELCKDLPTILSRLSNKLDVPSYVPMSSLCM